ncbi:nuclear transport factor 2 family protein [Pectobacterium brasiliense]|uniref:nuclear transport factor 2 family protein n=1 Tax=Pectobacterium brasiliense TaxID=180957 RepID=UPI00094A742D|nr:nuclear transport factor 2 family protein [Pectobacterium brasiliense]APS30144.1 transcriptional regulator [Pectobacterium brasiliense]MBN3099436.1 nuclear transport factor 2 family protein [Pectobacterium brasiliense]MBN3102756.1 nuclear transport factor 2 family protein [Pectobacterium brasiliense]MBN3165205.1 nuclear transport factor 2 family protein [Pectobacterium brasiliense]MBN3230109.1 nuclear transport factor 2 family protein [Pectobacterium brasiliense]
MMTEQTSEEDDISLESSEYDSILLKIKTFYRSLTREGLTDLGDIYHQDIHFIDPVSSHNGLNALHRYFSHALKHLSYCQLEITDIHTFRGGATMFWTMHYAHPSLKRNTPLTLAGCSHLLFADNKVIYHRDYYDMGEMLYQHVPLLGSLIRYLKSRIQS